MDECAEESVRQASLQVQSQFFYEESNINMLASLTKDSKPRSKRYMECLVDTVSRVIGLIDSNWNSETGGIVTRKFRKGKATAGIINFILDGAESDEETEIVVKSSHERTLSLTRFLNNFAFESVITTYCSLLSHFEHLEEDTIKHITKMFGYISDTHFCDKEALFFQVSTFNIFYSVLSSSKSRNSKFADLKALIRVITSSAISKLEEQPDLLVELFFSKTRGDCARIQNGGDYDFYEEKEKEIAVTFVLSAGIAQ